MAREGCAYGQVTRNMVENIEKYVKNMSEDVKLLTNHYSKRLPGWVTVIGTLGGTLLGGLIIWAVTR